MATLDLLPPDAVLVLDGGLSTALEALGATLGSDPLWSARLLLAEPDLIARAHVGFARAGADVAITSSYQASFEGFAARGLDRNEAAALLRRSVMLAREALEAWWGDEAPSGRRRPLVAASVGPYGAVLADGSEYVGRYGRTVEDLRRFHGPRLETLASAGPDVFAVETIPSGTEAEALGLALATVPEIPAWVSFQCADGDVLADGTPIEHAIAAVVGASNVVAVGVNCTAPRHVSSLLDRAGTSTDLPLVAYPNRGGTWDGHGKTWTRPTDDPPLAEAAPDWIARGSLLVGGCCGTGFDDIAALAAVIARP
jgi:homocysteine S-methyltransferase